MRMKKLLPLKILTSLTMVCFMLSVEAQVSLWDGSQTKWTKGSGTQSDPYLIENAANLAYLAYEVNNGIGAVNNVAGVNTYYKLTTDIDLNGSESLPWIPIGAQETYEAFYFGGHFDGNNHTVKNLYISNYRNAGLFGLIYNASVRNLGITGNNSIEITRTDGSNLCVGAIVGRSVGTINIENCFNTEDVSASYDNSSSYLAYVGGIIGYCESYVKNTSFIKDCYNTGNVFGQGRSGGIAGSINVSKDSDNNIYMAVINCYNTGEISSTGASGGIAGSVQHSLDSMIIRNCYNTGTISVSGQVHLVYASLGGIIGDGNKVLINYCNNMGDVSSSVTSYNSRSGGIIGNTLLCNIANCYNTGDISDISASNSNAGGIAGYDYALSFGTLRSIINNCYNRGDVSAASSSKAYAGGIFGARLNQNSNISMTISNSYSTGIITASGSSSGTYYGGVVGYSGDTGYENTLNVDNCYYLNDGNTSNDFGGISKTETEMKTAEFVELLNNNQTPLAWNMDEQPDTNDGYPILIWKESPVSVIPDVTFSDNNISVYPNPVTDHVIISIKEENFQDGELFIYNINGQKIISEEITQNEISQHTGDLIPGIYLLKIVSNGKVTGYCKLIKK